MEKLFSYWTKVPPAIQTVIENHSFAFVDSNDRLLEKARLELLDYGYDFIFKHGKYKVFLIGGDVQKEDKVKKVYKKRTPKAKKEKFKRGPGAGRKSMYKEPTEAVAFRLPISIIDEVKEIVFAIQDRHRISVHK